MRTGHGDASGWGIGIVGTGNIAEQYLSTLAGAPGVELVAATSRHPERSSWVSEHWGIPVVSLEQLLDDPRVDIVLNLTTPGAHQAINEAAVRAGKHVYCEKPLALNTADGARLLDLAAKTGVRVGVAPDTFLGAGISSATAALATLGEPVGAQASWVAPGHEAWHPNPQFYYDKGGGPLFDMGPYYLTALVELLGPVKQVAGASRTSARQRRVANGPKAGTRLDVSVDTHVSALLWHEAGAVSTLTVSFEGWASRARPIEVFATGGSLSVPDPNRFDGVAEVWHAGDEEWRPAPQAESADVSGNVTVQGRGMGLIDMLAAIEAGRPHRADGVLGLHVLTVMEAIESAASTGAVVAIRD